MTSCTVIHKVSRTQPSWTSTFECLFNKAFGEIYQAIFKVFQDPGQIYCNLGHGSCGGD